MAPLFSKPKLPPMSAPVPVERSAESLAAETDAKAAAERRRRGRRSTVLTENPEQLISSSAPGLRNILGG